MNTKGTKFLAVLAVLAMAFAGFAILAEVETADAVSANVSAHGSGSVPEDGSDYTFYGGFEGQMTLTVSGSSIEYKGLVNNNKVYEETVLGETSADQMGVANAYVYAMVGIGFTTGAGYDVKIVQTNSALAALYPTKVTSGTSEWGSDGYVIQDGVKTTYYATAFEAAQVLDVLVPIDGSKVTLEISKKAEGGDTVTTDTLTLDFSKTYTVTTLDAAIEVAGYAWDGEQLVLNNYNGNAVFTGAIQQVTLEGDSSIVAPGAPFAIQSTYAAEIKIKPVMGQGSLSIEMDDSIAVAAIIATAAPLTIQGSDITISIDNVAEEPFPKATAISTIGKLTIYESTLVVSMDKDANSTAVTATAIEMMSCNNVNIESRMGFVEVGNIDVAASNLTINAVTAMQSNGKLTAIKESTIVNNTADIVYDIQNFGTVVGAIDIESDSTLTTNNMALCAGISTNNATVTVNGDLIVLYKGDAAQPVLVNKASFSVAKNVLVEGKIDNQGSFDVDGKMIVSGIKDKDDATLAIDGASNGEATYAIFVDVTLERVTILPDGSAFGMVMLVDDGAVTYEGLATLTIDSAGKLLGLEVKDLFDDDAGEETDTAVSIIFVEDETQAKQGYEISVSGRDRDFDDSELKDLATAATVCAANSGVDDGILIASVGTLTVTGGITVNKAQDTLTTGTGAIFADITANAIIATDGGAIAGNIVASANIDIDADLAGNIEVAVADLDITVAGDMTGNVITDKDAEIFIDGTLTGDVVVNNADVLVSKGADGTIAGNLLLSGNYKPVSEEVLYNASVALNLQKTVAAVEVYTKKAVNPAPGYIYVEGDLSAPKAKNVATLTATSGDFMFMTTLEIEDGFGFSAAAGSTVTIQKSKVVTIHGAIVVNKDAVFNYKAVDKSYGDITNEMVFTVGDETYYCSFTYALDNAPEGTALDLTKDPENPVASAVAVKKNVVITIADGVILTFTNKSLTMGEGAGFVLGEGSKVVFAATADKEKISANFTYGDNKIVFTDVVFTADSNVKAVKGSTTVADRISVKASYNAGTIDLVAGEFTSEGDVTFVNVDDKTSGTFNINSAATYVGSFATSTKAKIVIDGVYAPANGPTFTIALSGAGTILLAEAKAVTFAADVSAEGKEIKQNITITDGINSVALADAYSKTSAVTFTAVKATSSVPANIAIAGADDNAVLYGKYTINGDATFATSFDTVEKTLIIAEKESTISVAKTKDLNANGLIKAAGTVNIATDDDNSYGTITRQVEYKDGDYTVYTMLATAITEGGVTDFTVNSDIVLAGGAAETPKNLGDVTLAVAEGKTLTITGFVTLGTASTSLAGAAAITGKVILDAGAVLIVYDNADVSADNVFQDDGTTKALKSEFIVDKGDVLYATAFNDGTVTLVNVEKSLNPNFPGYRFSGYTNVVAGAGAGATVGQTDVMINVVAGKVSITLASVEGVTYYVNGVACKQTGAPLEVTVGDVVSAQANAGYTGTVKVNGQDYVIVDSATKTITASGASPITPEPEPEQGGLGLTEILLIVLVILIAIMVVVLLIKLNRS